MMDYWVLPEELSTKDRVLRELGAHADPVPALTIDLSTDFMAAEIETTLRDFRDEGIREGHQGLPVRISIINGTTHDAVIATLLRFLAMISTEGEWQTLLSMLAKDGGHTWNLDDSSEQQSE